MSNNKKEKTFDEYQKAAINVEKNAVVSAGAGSGKTTVLAERFLHLIQKQNGYNVDEILTLTFTKKATVEMSDRIYKVLKEKAPEQAANFYKANIKTLDSYCNSVAKIGAHLYGISPDFTQDDHAINNQAYEKALPFILEHRENRAIKELVNTKDYAQIANELFVQPILKNSTIAEPIDFDLAFKKQTDEIIQEWTKISNKISGLHHSLTEELNAYQGNIVTLIRNVSNLIQTTNFPSPIPLTEQQIFDSDSEMFEAYAKVIYDFSHVSQSGGNAACGPIKLVLNEMRTHADTLISICNFISGFHLIRDLIPLLKDFQEVVNNIKRSSNVLTFKDVSNLALCILRDHPDIRALEKQKYKAIMIDEFQDNNSQQRDMLFLLAEKPERMDIGIPTVEELCPEKLFFVGDEKQSIYIFRGADVSVFNELANNFKENNLQMTNNYRSESALIAAFNTIFGGLHYPPEEYIAPSIQKNPPAAFYTEKDAQNNSVPNYQPVYHKVTLPNFRKEAIEEAQKNGTLAEVYKPRVHIALYNNNQDVPENHISDEEAEAEWIAQKIDDLISKGQNPSEIAILFRNYSLQPVYEKTFLKHGIPYNTETVTGLYSDGPVNDIMAFLKICVYPNDTISYAQVLRSPFVNLSMPETMAVISNNKEPFAEGSETILEGKSAEIYKKMQSFFKTFSANVLSVPISQSITTLWYDMGYRFETMWNHTVEMYGKLYDLMFELARQADQQNMGLSGFIDLVSSYESSKLDDMDIPLDQPAGVHIMSIHKSKGLEFEVVFVAASHKLPKADSNSSPVYSSKDFGVTINTPPCATFSDTKSQYFYNKVKEEKDLKLAAELRRIAYVALTRAKKELYITNGKYKNDKKATTKFNPVDGTNNVRCIFDVLYPIVHFYQEDQNSAYSPFTIEEIPTYPRFAEVNTESKSRQNSLSAKKHFISELEADSPYNKAEASENIIKKDILQSKYTNPSKLHKADDETSPDIESRYEPIKGTAYPEITDFVRESIPAEERKLHNENKSYEPKPRFDFTDFGTIAHAFMEAAMNNKKPVISNKNLVGLDNNQEKINRIFQICTEMTEKFKNSSIGKIASGSTEYHAEYEFRSRVANKIIKGIIDLVFKNPDGTYTVLDYKTNQTEEPEIYYNQLACYRQAVAQMLGISDVNSIKCYLFYLRSGHEVDITEACNKVDLEKAILTI